MKTITASKPAANPGQFTKIPSNPLLLSAQSQMMKVEQVKRTKEIVRKTEEEPEWQSNLNVWKDRRRKQSEDALQRVSEIKKVDDDPSMDSGLEQRKLSLGKKLSSLVHNDDDDDWLGPVTKNGFQSESVHSFNSSHRSASTSSIPLPPSSIAPPPPMKDPQPPEPRRKASPKRSRSTGVLMSSEEIKQTTEAAQLQSQPLRRKSSELSNSMKSRLEAFEASAAEDLARKSSSTVPPDETFKQKLESFKEKEIEKDEDAASKYLLPPKKSITDFLNPPEFQNSLGSKEDDGHIRHLASNAEEYQDVEEDDDDVDKLLDDALEESYRSVLENEEEHNLSGGSSSGKSVYSCEDFSPSSGPPKEKPPPPPLEPPPSFTPPPVTKKSFQAETELYEEQNKRHHQMNEEEMDKQERDIIAGLEAEEKEHLKYMESVSSMKNMSINNSHSISMTSSSNSSTSISATPKSPQKQQQQQHSPSQTKQHSYDEKLDSPKKKSSSERNINHHWLIQEAEQRRISEMQQQKQSSQQLIQQQQRSSSSSNLVSQNKTSPNYARSNNVGPTYENSVDLRNNKANLMHQPGGQQPIPNQNSNSSSLHFSKQQQNMSQQQPIYNNYPPNSSNASNNNNNNIISYNYENTYANVQAQQQMHHSPPGQGNNYPAMRESINNIANHHPTNSNARVPGPQVPPRNMENPDRMLSVSGKKKCSHCREELGRGAAMIIESLRLYYHLRCFQCCVCQIQLGNGTAGTDVRVRNNKLHCQNCYSNDEGLKFSKV
eukprot:TRINITY_DN3466_c0_g3_i4.p1 TRINITY_DN3466_c0_g3~~TRINITY_DN3466_c0_g3_i4.p1  ORF type:complete len:772 (+),score=260.42 TRINITY_DN3466_c0_g3_i4:243-2558(+)